MGSSPGQIAGETLAAVAAQRLDDIGYHPKDGGEAKEDEESFQRHGPVRGDIRRPVDVGGIWKILDADGGGEFGGFYPVFTRVPFATILCAVQLEEIAHVIRAGRASGGCVFGEVSSAIGEDAMLYHAVMEQAGVGDAITENEQSQAQEREDEENDIGLVLAFGGHE